MGNWVAQVFQLIIALILILAIQGPCQASTLLADTDKRFVDRSSLYRSSKVQHRFHHRPDGLVAGDYCLNERFNITCSLPGHAQQHIRHQHHHERQGKKLILIRAARFGRMRPGRCIGGNFNVGCSKDVKGYFDTWCSGKQSCDVTIRDLVDLHPCQRDFVSYLEASYSCVTVYSMTRKICPSDGSMTINLDTSHPDGNQGYLNPSLPGSGGLPCPWTIKTAPGQKINLTLITLTPEPLNTGYERFGAVMGGSCGRVLVVTDVSVGREFQYKTCQSNKGEESRHLHKSAGNALRVHMTSELGLTTNGLEAEEGPAFLIHFEAVGCPDIDQPPNAWLYRHSSSTPHTNQASSSSSNAEAYHSADISSDTTPDVKSSDNIMIKCNSTDESWFLACVGNNWKGVVGNCSEADITGSQVFVDVIGRKNPEQNKPPFTVNGVLLAIILGMILGVGVGIVLLVLVYMSRRGRTKKRRPPSSTGLDCYSYQMGRNLSSKEVLEELCPITHTRAPTFHHHVPNYFGLAEGEVGGLYPLTIAQGDPDDLRCPLTKINPMAGDPGAPDNPDVYHGIQTDLDALGGMCIVNHSADVTSCRANESILHSQDGDTRDNKSDASKQHSSHDGDQCSIQRLPGGQILGQGQTQGHRKSPSDHLNELSHIADRLSSDLINNDTQNMLFKPHYMQNPLDTLSGTAVRACSGHTVRHSIAAVDLLNKSDSPRRLSTRHSEPPKTHTCTLLGAHPFASPLHWVPGSTLPRVTNCRCKGKTVTGSASCDSSPKLILQPDSSEQQRGSSGNVAELAFSSTAQLLQHQELPHYARVRKQTCRHSITPAYMGIKSDIESDTGVSEQYKENNTHIQI